MLDDDDGTAGSGFLNTRRLFILDGRSYNEMSNGGY